MTGSIEREREKEREEGGREGGSLRIDQQRETNDTDKRYI